jgi:serine-type D-Ala-D-Ala carboxypeptidase/endopeptidase
MNVHSPRPVFAAATAFGFACLALGPSYADAQDAPPRRRVDHSRAMPSSEYIRELLTERVRSNGVGMVVGVIDPAGRRVIAIGRSGADDGRPLDGDTVFQIGSATKTFTTLILADMVQRGEVRLNDPAAKYLPPGVTMPERGRPITLLDLATHRSGLPTLPDNYAIHGEPNPIEAYTIEQLHHFLSNHTLAREPGEKREYSNLAVALLGRLLARHVGMEYEELLQMRVLRPLGMRSSAITPSPQQLARLAPGHDRYLQPVDSWEMRTLPASGSLRSTANDLLHFLAAYLDYEDTSLRSAMALQRAAHYPGDREQALGWAVAGSGNETTFRHEGGKAGYRSAIAFNPGTGTGVVVLANARTDYRLGEIAMHLLTGSKLAPAVPAPIRQKRVTLSDGILDAYAGRYQLEPGRLFSVIRKGDHLLTDLYGDGGAEFFPVSEHDFVHNYYNDELTFQVDAEGRVTGLLQYGDGRAAGTSTWMPRIAEAP